MPLSRRSFVKVLGLGPALFPAGSLPAAIPDTRPLSTMAAGETSGDPRIELPFRHIHQDFHTSPAITGVGEEFRADEYAQTLKNAAVNSITVFAKCHHGMSYYPTKVGIQHPHLKIDLLGQMIEACHIQGIQVVSYISTMYDQYMWRRHGDWRVLDEHGGEVGLEQNAGPLKAELGRVCINTPMLDYLARQAEEVVKEYDIDGMWYDNMIYPLTSGCCCAYCMADRERLGLDSTKPQDRVRHSQIVMDRAMKTLAPIVQNKNPNLRLFFNGPIAFQRVPFMRECLKYYTHIEIESLPGGSWGYSFYEIAARYERNLGLDTMGMTGAFHRSWGDFGAVRNQAALDYECFRMLALGNQCAIGDHLHPRGKLNPVTYERIGRAYRSVAEKEPWCRNARPVTEIGTITLLTRGYHEGLPHSDIGAANVLQESHHQFDVLDTESPFDKYRVILLPDSHRMDGALLAKLRQYLAGGGALILSHESGLDENGREFALTEIGVTYEGPWQHEFQYVEVIDGAVNRRLPHMVQIFYEKGGAVRLQPGTQLLGRIWKSYFDRNYMHFQVEQTPFSEPTDYVGVAQRGKVIYIAAPIFRTYADFAYQFYRLLVANCITRLLPDPLIKSDAPSTARITVTEQPGRRIVHVLQYLPERRAPNVDVVEDVIPLINVKLALRSGTAPRRVYLAPQRHALQADFRDGYVQVLVPSVEGHQMVVFES
jgi:hypothetical protein